MIASPGSDSSLPSFYPRAHLPEDTQNEQESPIEPDPAPALDGPSLGTLRTVAGLSRADLARRLGLCKSVVSLYERGKVRIPQERIPTILSVLIPLADTHSQAYATLRQTLSLPVSLPINNIGGPEAQSPDRQKEES